MKNHDVLDRLVRMIQSTNIIALDKTLSTIRRADFSFAAATDRCGSIAERMLRAVHEVRQTLPNGRQTVIA